MSADHQHITDSQILAEIQAGEGLSLAAAGRLFPGHRGQGTVNPSTTFRWAMKGNRAAGGEVVKLEAVRVGGRWLTSRGAVARFVARLTSATGVVPTRSPARRNRDSERAGRELERRGS